MLANCWIIDYDTGNTIKSGLIFFEREFCISADLDRA